MFKRQRRFFLILGLGGSVIGLLVAWVVSYAMPRKYESQSVVEVRLWVPGTPSKLSGDGQVTHEYTREAATELKSHALLAIVVDNLKLSDKWRVNREAAVQILIGMVEITNMHASDLISIKVRDTNREFARNLAAGIMNAYRNDHDADLVLKALEREISNRQDLDEELQKVFTIWNKAKWAKGIDTRLPGDPIEDDRIDDGITDRFSAKEMVEIYLEQRVKKKDNLKALEELHRKQIEMTEPSKGGLVRVIIREDPQVSTSPISPNVPLNLLFGTALGFLFSALIVVSRFPLKSATN